MKFKVLDRLFIRGFIGPCLLAFFIVEFVLIMQNLWKVIDSILGKGYGLLDFMELLYYFGVAIIPMALPLTILLSSVMVYGDMAEKYELSSAKSAGISFLRLLKPGLAISVMVFLFSILASNVLKPEANKGFYKKMRDMKTNKLTFVFDEKIFNREFKDFSIRIGRKDKDGRTIDDVLIYDHTDADNSVVNMIRSKKGEMYTTPDQKYLIMDLKDGYQIKEIREESADRSRKGHNAFARPVARFKFSSLRKVFNLSEMLDLNVVNISYRQYEMMNTLQLINAIDSLNNATELAIAKNIREFNLFTSSEERMDGVPSDLNEGQNVKKNTKKYNQILQERKDKKSGTTQSTTSQVRQAQKAARAKKNESLVQIHFDKINDQTRSIMEVVKFADFDKVIGSMRKNTLALKTHNSNNKQEVRMINRNKDRYVFNLHQIYSWATVCIIFLFIGAPAGAIVRKGGFGYPLLIAIGFYLTFVMTSIIGKKLMGSGALSGPLGAWLPCLTLIPFAVYLTWRAMHDNRSLIKPFMERLKITWLYRKRDAR